MIPLRPSITVREENGITVFLPEAAINSSDAKEFSANDRYEQSVRTKCSEQHIFDDIVTKSDFIRTFRNVAHLIDIRDGHTVLELGASHGWASTITKLEHPGAYVVCSDLVPDCVRHASNYEQALSTRLDERWAFSVRNIPFADASFDRIFTFAAFHHFGDHGDYSHSLAEIARVLKPGGKIVLLFEPSAPAFLYKTAFRRVNRRRGQEAVDEDVLVLKRLRAIATSLGLATLSLPFPIFQYRTSVAATFYFYLISKASTGPPSHLYDEHNLREEMNDAIDTKHRRLASLVTRTAFECAAA